LHWRHTHSFTVKLLCLLLLCGFLLQFALVPTFILLLGFYEREKSKKAWKIPLSAFSPFTLEWA
jgi:hypothetical protein